MIQNDSNIIQSLSRGLEALEFIAIEPTSPKQLAQHLGIDRSSAYRILMTLAAHGFVERNIVNDLFVLSSHKIFGLGSAITGNLHLPTLVTPWLRQLRDTTGEGATLAVLQGHDVVYVNHLPSSEVITVSPMLGLRRPLYVSAVGKAIWAFLPEQVSEKLLEEIELVAYTNYTITDRDQLRKELASIQANGYATDSEETFIGVRCIAAPVRDHSGEVVAALGITGPAWRLSEERMHEYGTYIKELTQEFSASMGAPVLK